MVNNFEVHGGKEHDDELKHKCKLCDKVKKTNCTSNSIKKKTTQTITLTFIQCETGGARNKLMDISARELMVLSFSLMFAFDTSGKNLTSFLLPISSTSQHSKNVFERESLTAG